MHNKYQEALDRLKTIKLDIIEDGETKLNQSVYGIHDYADLEKRGDLELMQELVDKATPVKPFKESLADRLCGNCGCYISFDALNDNIEYAPKYCTDCGTKIDWSDEIHDE